MAVVLAVVIEPLPDHLHNLGESHPVVRQVRNFGHERCRGSPRVIAGRFSDLDLEKHNKNSHEVFSFGSSTFHQVLGMKHETSSSVTCASCCSSGNHSEEQVRLC